MPDWSRSIHRFGSGVPEEGIEIDSSPAQGQFHEVHQPSLHPAVNGLTSDTAEVGRRFDLQKSAFLLSRLPADIAGLEFRLVPFHGPNYETLNPRKAIVGMSENESP